jgi:hypothetical protein
VEDAGDGIFVSVARRLLGGRGGGVVNNNVFGPLVVALVVALPAFSWRLGAQNTAGGRDVADGPVPRTADGRADLRASGTAADSQYGERVEPPSFTPEPEGHNDVWNHIDPTTAVSFRRAA